MNKEDLLNYLSKKNFEYILFDHPPLYTVEDSKKMRGKIEGVHSKNLFLKNKKNQFFLFSCEESTSVNLKNLGKSLNIGNISFAKEEHLLEILGVTPGSVTPFGLLNDKKKQVKFFLDKKILIHKKVNFHPLENTSTITIDVKKFVDLMIENKKNVHVFDFDNYSII